jgi:cell division protein FtsX
MYLIRLAGRPWRRSFWSQLSASGAVGLLLILAAGLLSLQRGLGPVVVRLEQSQVLTAYLDSQVTAAEEAQTLDRIRLKLGSSARDVRLVGAEQFLTEIRANYPELVKELEALGDELPAVVPRYVSVEGVFRDNPTQALKSVPGIQGVDTSRDRYRAVIGAFHAFRKLSGVLASGLAIALLTGLILLARMNHQLLEDSLSVLHFWGASAMSLRVPPLLAGFSVGALGGAWAALAWWAGAPSVHAQLVSLSPVLSGLDSPPRISVALMLLAAGALSGALSGAWGRSGKVAA